MTYRCILFLMILGIQHLGSGQPNAGLDGTATQKETKGVDSSSLDAQLTVLVNEFRAQNGLFYLVKSPLMRAVAQGHADDMALNHYRSHFNLSGNGPLQRVLLRAPGFTGIVAENWWYCEHCAGTDQELAKEIVNDWSRSNGHRANMLARNVVTTDFGVARVAARTYVVQILSRSTAPGVS
jgi:uncharacterized protein YkwD